MVILDQFNFEEFQLLRNVIFMFDNLNYHDLKISLTISQIYKHNKIIKIIFTHYGRVQILCSGRAREKLIYKLNPTLPLPTCITIQY